MNSNENKSISFSHAENYCVDCGKKESYNGNKPFTAPIKCRYCGGRMTNKQEEKMIIEFEKNLNGINFDKIKQRNIIHGNINKKSEV